MILPKRIGVIFGGPSSEKEVSLEGGRNVYHKLDRSFFSPLPLFVDSERRVWKISDALLLQNTVRDVESGLASEGERIPFEALADLIDFAFIVGHGKYLEDGSMQGLLELLGIPYNGPGILASAIGANKWMTRLLLIHLGFDVPKTVPVSKSEWGRSAQSVKKIIDKKLTYPVYVKPVAEGCSTALTRVTLPDELDNAIEKAFQWDPVALVEEAIEGTEVTVSVLGNEEKLVLPPTETPWSKGHTYLTLEDKFLPGGAEMITPARLEQALMEKVKDTAKKICEQLRFLGYPRLDMFVTKDGRVVTLEANTLPGITPSTMVFHQAAEEGMSPAQFLTRIIELGAEAHAQKKGTLV